jgi:nucleoside-diphosphate-sugar epimerase
MEFSRDLPTQRLAGISDRVPRFLDDGDRILLTGATGFIGRWLLAAVSRYITEMNIDVSISIVSRSQSLVVQINNQDFFKTRKRIKHVFPDELRRRETIEKYDAIAHLAAYTGKQTRETGLETIRADTLLLLNLADALSETGRVPRLLVGSSGAVYGRNRQSPVLPREGDAAPVLFDGQVTLYDDAKRASEAVGRAIAHSGLATVAIARMFAFVGPGLPLTSHFAIGNFLGDALSGRPIAVKGSGLDVRSWMDASDLAETLLGLWSQTDSDALTVNVGSSEGMTILDAARTVSAIADVPIDHVWVGEPPPQTFYVPNIEKLAGILDTSRHKSFELSVEDHLNWLRGS